MAGRYLRGYCFFCGSAVDCFLWVHGLPKLLNFSVAEGQFGWLLLILFSRLFIAGPRRRVLNVRFAGALRYV